MSTITSIPIKVTPEAATRISELGMQRELEIMIEHTCQTIPGLRAVEVQLALPYDTGGEPRIVIEAQRPDPGREYDPTDIKWAAWMHQAFPRQTSESFLLMSVYETGHAG
jgi:hypothetical protein